LPSAYAAPAKENGKLARSPARPQNCGVKASITVRFRKLQASARSSIGADVLTPVHAPEQP
jgi:hypothetical protein